MFLIAKHIWRYAIYRSYLNLVGEASRYHLGWLWWFLEPIAMTGVFFFVFTYLRPVNSEGFTYFIMVGVTTWLWFANSVGNSTECLAANKELISQIRLPKMTFPIISVVGASMKHCFVLGIVLLVVGFVFGPAQAWFALPILLLVQVILILSVSSTVAFICCWIRDTRFIVRSGLTLMMFCSGLFFSIDSMPAELQAYFRLNPMAVLIEQYRTVLLTGNLPNFAWCAMTTLAGMAWIYMINWIYVRFDLLLTRRVLA